jgi:two-component SAPR family response regulator
MKTNFILVDDDCVSNLIGRKIIKNVFPDADVYEFLDPETALLYIQSTYSKNGAPDTLLLLDINMPTISGWEFLEAFERFDTRVKEHFKIHMLSSSVAPCHKERAANNKNVSGYIEKPLTLEGINAILKERKAA